MNALSDNLELNGVSIPAHIPKEVIFPDELNRYLKDQVQSLTRENGMLRRNISENEVKLGDSKTEIERLTSRLEDFQSAEPSRSVNASNYCAGSKIIELSKKLRVRNSEIEIYRSKCSKLETYILGMERRDDEKVEDCQGSDSAESDQKSQEDQVKLVQDKLNAANGKLCELRNINVLMKNDLKLANKLLHQEIGDGFESLHSFATSHTNWRGRAQLIRDLQSKIADLKNKLKTKEDKEQANTTVQLPIKNDKKFETLENEHTQLLTSFQQLQKKFENAKGRIKAIESECNTVRGKLARISEEKRANDKLIEALKHQQTALKDRYEESIKQKETCLQTLESEHRHLQLRLRQETCKVENLTTELTELENLKKQEKNPCHAFVDDNDKKVGRLEAERLRLLELTEICNDRLQIERNNHTDTKLKYQIERQKAAKLEAKLARLELERQSDKCSVYSSFSEKSRDLNRSSIENRLELAKETIKLLETRLQLEQQEKRLDFQRFGQVLKSYEHGTDRDDQ